MYLLMPYTYQNLMSCFDMLQYSVLRGLLAGGLNASQSCKHWVLLWLDAAL